MPELKGSKTEQNLWTAFAGESQARNKYTYFASKAKKEGYVQIAQLFEETAANEKEHAKIWFKLLGGIGTTAENLEAAAAGENFPGGGLPRHRRPVRGGSQNREGARGALPQAAGQRGGRPGLLPGRRHDLAVRQLRPHPRGPQGPGGLPCLRPSPGLFSDQSGELLIAYEIGAPVLAAGAPVYSFYSSRLWAWVRTGLTPAFLPFS